MAKKGSKNVPAVQGKQKRMSGGAVMRQSGKKPVLLGLTEDQAESFRQAADQLGIRALTVFIIEAAEEKANKINARTQAKK